MCPVRSIRPRRLLSFLVVAAWALCVVAACTSGGESALDDVRVASPIVAAIARPSPICARYLGCVARGPDAADRFGEQAIAYGDGAACWTGDPELAADCSAACREGALAMPDCGECDEDAACPAGLACVARRCAPPGCRVDVRRADALIAAACACGDDCEGYAAFVHLLAHAAGEADCADTFAAWVGCEALAGPCKEGRIAFYETCENELARLTACENRGASLRCP